MEIFKGTIQTKLPNTGTYIFAVMPAFIREGDEAIVFDKNEMEFARWLVEEHKIAAIPIAPFYNNNDDHKVLRFCFAKKDETLVQAAEILAKI